MRCGPLARSSRLAGFNADAAVADEAAGPVEHRLPAHPVLLSRAIGIDAAEHQIDEWLPFGNLCQQHLSLFLVPAGHSVVARRTHERLDPDAEHFQYWAGNLGEAPRFILLPVPVGGQFGQAPITPFALAQFHGAFLHGLFQHLGVVLEFLVKQPDLQVTQPPSRTNNAGTTATFSATARGNPPPSYQWRKDDLDLADGGNISGAATNTLSLSNVLKRDEGSYRVVATNALGSVTSLVATLTVIEPVILTQPQSLTNLAGTTATFTVAATGTEPFAYQWQKLSGNWSDLADCTNIALILTNVQISQAGDYRVVVTNVHGAAHSAVVHLTVLGPKCQHAPDQWAPQ